MADETIIQRMGFEAGGAIESINSLKIALEGLNKILGITGGEIRSWNTGGKGASKAFEALNKSAGGLLKQFEAIGAAQANMLTGGGAAAPVTGVESQLNLVKNLTSTWGAIPDTASAASREAYSKGIANLAQFATANKLTSQQMLKAFTDTSGKLKGPIGEAARLFNGLSAAQKAMVREILGGNQRVGISFKTLVQIMQFRLMISGITALITKFKEGVTAGADFSQALGRIQTVAERGVGMEAISAQLEASSRKYASTLEETTSAYYLILQNQVGGTTNALKVLDSAMKLHVATGATVKEAADTLTVAINGMGLSFDNTADIGGKLFKAVEIGRFEFKEMGNVLGMLGPLTRELGVEFEEIMGPITTMTRSGVGFSRAVTQMRAVLAQTLKPTNELKRIFKTWGVEDAQQAIAKFGGLLPMMKALEDATHGSTTELAKAFTRLRALTGAVSILGKNYQEALDDTNKIKDATGALTDEVYKMVEATEGFKFHQTVNQLSIDFAKLGESALPVLNKLASGLQYLTEHLTGAGTAVTSGGLISLGVLLSGSVVSLFKLVAGFESLGIVLKSLGWGALITALLTGSYLAGRALGNWINLYRGIGDASKALEEHIKIMEQQGEVEKVNASTSAKTLEKIKAANKEVTNTLIAGLTASKAAYAKTDDAILNHNKYMVKGLKASIESLIDRQQTLVTKLTELSDEDGTKMAAAVTKRNKTATAASDKAFGFQISNLENVRKSYKQTERSQDSMNEAMSKLSKAQSPEDFETIDALLQRAASFAEGASSSVEQEKNNRVLLWKTREQELRVANALTTVDNKRISVQAQAAANAKSILDAETKTLDVMKENVAAILKGRSLATSEGVKKKDAQAIKDRNAGLQAEATLLARLQSPEARKAMNVADMLGLGNLIQRRDAMVKNLPDTFARVEFDYRTSLNKLTTRFQDNPFTAKVIFDYDIQALDYEGSLARAAVKIGEELNQKEGIVSAYQAETANLNIAIKDRAKSYLKTSQESLVKYRKQEAQLFKENWGVVTLGKVGKTFEQLQIASQALFKTDPQNVEAFRAALKTATDAQIAFEEASVDPNLRGKKFIADNADQIQRTKDLLADIGPKFNALQGLTANTKKAADEIIDLKNLLEQIRTGTNIKIEGTLVLDMVSMGTSATTIATGTQNTNTALASAAPNANSMAAAYERMAMASQNIKTPPVAQAMGGMMRFANGGRAHGTDTIPAMLSPGEFVVNARSTRQFFSQLVAMNAGVKPIYREGGGAITNIGDINVTVPGGPSTRQTAREIATALRREVRRGTSKL